MADDKKHFTFKTIFEVAKERSKKNSGKNPYGDGLQPEDEEKTDPQIHRPHVPMTPHKLAQMRDPNYVEEETEPQPISQYAIPMTPQKKAEIAFNQAQVEEAASRLSESHPKMFYADAIPRKEKTTLLPIGHSLHRLQELTARINENFQPIAEEPNYASTRSVQRTRFRDTALDLYSLKPGTFIEVGTNMPQGATSYRLQITEEENGKKGVKIWPIIETIITSNDPQDRMIARSAIRPALGRIQGYHSPSIDDIISFDLHAQEIPGQNEMKSYIAEAVIYPHKSLLFPNVLFTHKDDTFVDMPSWGKHNTTQLVSARESITDPKGVPIYDSLEDEWE